MREKCVAQDAHECNSLYDLFIYLHIVESKNTHILNNNQRDNRGRWSERNVRKRRAESGALWCSFQEAGTMEGILEVYIEREDDARVRVLGKNHCSEDFGC